MEKDFSTLPFPIAYYVKRLNDYDFDGVLLKRIGLYTNKIVRILVWIAISEKLFDDKELGNLTLQILKKKKKLNSDWLKLLEMNNNLLSEHTLEIFHKILSMRNAEAHLEKDLSNVSQDEISTAFNLFFRLVDLLKKDLSNCEMVNYSRERVILTGADSAKFNKRVYINFGSKNRTGIYFKNGNKEFSINSMFYIEFTNMGCEFYTLDTIGNNSKFLDLDGNDLLIEGNPLEFLFIYDYDNVDNLSGTINSITQLNIGYYSNLLPLYIQREEIENQLTDFFQISSDILFIEGQSGAGVSTFILNTVKKLKEDVLILYTKNIKQLMNESIKIKLLESKLTDVGILICIDELSNYKELMQFLAYKDNAIGFKFVVGIYPEVMRKAIEQDVLVNIQYSLKSMPILNDEEVKNMIKLYAESYHISFPLKLLDILIKSANLSLRKPNIIQLICRSLKDEDLQRDEFSIIHVLKIYEKNLIEKYGLYKDITYLVSLIIKKGTNAISFDEILGLSGKKKKLLDLGILEETSYGYSMFNEEYLNYLIANYVYSHNGIIGEFGVFKFWMKAIPYYISLIIENVTVDYLDYTPKDFDNETRLKIVDMLSYNEEILLNSIGKVIEFQDCLIYGRKSRNKGLVYQAALFFEKIGQSIRLENALQQELEAELIYTNYILTGQILESDDNMCPQYSYYMGMIKYYTDKYEESAKYFKDAFKVIEPSYYQYDELCLDYVEFLIDYGKYELANEKLKCIKNTNNPELTARVFSLYADIYIEELLFDEAIQALERSIKENKKINNLNSIAKCYGGLALINLYSLDFEAAKEYVDYNLFVCEMNNNLHGIAAANSILGELYLVIGEVDSAIEFLEVSSNYADEIGNLWRFNVSKLLSAVANNNNLSEYELVLLEKMDDDIESERYKITHRRLLSICYFKKDIKKSKKLMDEAISFARGIDSKLQFELCVIQNELLFNEKEKIDIMKSKLMKFVHGLIKHVEKDND